MKKRPISPLLCCAYVLICLCLNAADGSDIPIAHDVDIVIAGGGCGAVAAAESATRAGASVLLITSRNYLGEDIAGTMQLWLKPGEKPTGRLARELYTDPFFEETPGLDYTYTADQPSQARHPDTEPPSRLRRERTAMDPQHESVQYKEDVTISADLGQVTAVGEIAVTTFRRPRDFEARDVLVQVSADGDTWHDLGRFRCLLAGDRQVFSIPVRQSLRYVKLQVRRANSAKRILIGSIKFVGETPGTVTNGPRAVRPLHAKKTLETALRDAGATFLFGCYATEILTDSAGRVSGLVMTNRMGRQAVRAKAVIDATEHAVLARLAHARFRKPESATRTARWVVIAEKPTIREGLTVRKLPIPVTVYDLRGRQVTDADAAWYEYAIVTKTRDDLASRMALEKKIRDLCYNPTQLYTADMLLLVPEAGVVSRAPGAMSWKGVGALPLEACQPAGVEGLWVLGGHMDIPRSSAAELLRPAYLVNVGSRLGEVVAGQVVDRKIPQDVTVAPEDAGASGSLGTIREKLTGLRPDAPRGSVRDPGHSLPVFGRYDVVVVGGGTSGAPAGIAAARQGAKTLVVECLQGLGGVGTLGMIGKYWYGNRVGFSAEVPENPIEIRMRFYLDELRKAGGEAWFGVLGCGAVTEGDRVTGVVVATPFGRGVVMADVVIDGTGNADIAAIAGAKTQFVDAFFALQTSHIPPREIGASYINGNRAPVDAADPVDVTAAMMKFPNRAFDRGQIIASRERRRIVGEYQLDWLDVLNRRTFPDSITLAKSDYDSHGYQVHPYFMLMPSRVPSDHRRQFHGYVPYRCLLPKGLKGILVVGLAVSVHRDALPIVRMQPDLQNIGYAAGVAAAMSARSDKPLRKLDVDALQSTLGEANILGKDALAHTDSALLDTAALKRAIQCLPSSYEGLGAVMANAVRARPLLRAAYDNATGKNRLAYAHVLGVLGDRHGAETLVQEANACIAKGDFTYRREADGMDRITQLLWALGRSGGAQEMGAMCALADAGAINTSVRFRALVVSLGAAKTPKGIPTLTRLLKDKKRTRGVGELMAACALWQCGDPDGVAKEILLRLANGANGPFARLAQRMLAR